MNGAARTLAAKSVIHNEPNGLANSYSSPEIQRLNDACAKPTRVISLGMLWNPAVVTWFVKKLSDRCIFFLPRKCLGLLCRK